jgi:iron complex outermembrane receptor protein
MMQCLLLAGAAAVSSPVAGQTNAAATPADNGQGKSVSRPPHRDDIIVTGERLPADASSPYAGGRVARGASVGLLGTTEAKKSPFSIASYTEQLMLDRQSETAAEALDLDPSVRTTQGSGAPFDTFYIRGFPINEGTSGEIAFDGVFGVGPSFRILTDYAERVEVLRGPSAALTGASPNGGIGGVINVVPKQAVDDLTRITASYSSSLRSGAQADVARRFGSGKEWGARIVAGTTDGDTAFERQAERTGVVMMALDYRGSRLRTSLSLYAQSDHIIAPLRPYMLASGASVPKAPDGRTNLSQRWEYSDIDDRGGLFKAEFDVGRRLTLFAHVGGKVSQVDRYFGSARTILNGSGETSTAPGLYIGKVTSYAVEGGARLAVDTGPIQHRIVIRYSLYDDVFDRYLSASTTPYRFNLYSPGIAPYVRPVDRGIRPRLSDTRLEGVSIADTLSVWDEHVLLTLGGRRQSIQANNYLANVGSRTAAYDRSATTPVVGIVIRPNEQFSLYGNYVEGLSRGDVAPVVAVNAGEILSPYTARQIEAGVKLDFGRIGGTVSGFRIAKPIGELSPTRVFAQTGEQQVRGIEATIYGKLAPTLDIVGGGTLLDASLRKTALAVNLGNRPIGVPKVQINVGLDWKLSQRVSVNGSVVRTGRQFVDAANINALPAWTRFDLGARYAVTAAGRDIVLRANVVNVADARFWTGVASFGTFFQGAPRTVLLSASVDL